MPSESERAPQTTLQGVFLGLASFWTREGLSRPGLSGPGCLLLPPCDLAMSTGTLHPENFFHLLDPDPWRATWLQPLRRPADGRRRGHPFRLLKHLQLQVVLKPPPADVQTLYLRSLEALGFRLEIHDLRFSEWRWESAAIDAWGSGWHVLIDGLGVTRLTFLQQAVGRELEPVTVELSYGLERLAMVLADLPSAADVPWSAGGPSYGELRQQEETELSRWVFEVADPEGVRQDIDAAAGAADRCLAAGLPRPAYELTLRSLQGIETVDARGDLAKPERERLLARVRTQATAAAVLYLDQRRAAAGEPTPPAVAGAESPPADEAPAPEDRPQTKRSGKKKRARARRREASDGG